MTNSWFDLIKSENGWKDSGTEVNDLRFRSYFRHNF